MVCAPSAALCAARRVNGQIKNGSPGECCDAHPGCRSACHLHGTKGLIGAGWPEYASLDWLHPAQCQAHRPARR
jgi:hypothetical protein